MVRVLVTVEMDAERRAALDAVRDGAIDAVVLDGLPGASKARAWASADAVVCLGFPREFPHDLSSAAPNLRMVQTLLAGVDHVPFDRIPSRAVVCSNAGAYTMSVAEHAMALLLAAAKDVPLGTDEIRRGVFDQDVVHRPLGGATLLVVGLGAIGREVARLGAAFGMRVLAVARRARPDPLADEVGTLADLPTLVRRADFVVLALPLTRATDGLIDAQVLRRMREDAVLVNIARGKLVREDDLYEHLRSHPRFRAALDVWWRYPDGKEGRPFRRRFHGLPNVVMTPHVAFAIPGQRRVAMEAALRNVLRFARGEAPERVADPSEYAGRGSRRPGRTVRT